MFRWGLVEDLRWFLKQNILLQMTGQQHLNGDIVLCFCCHKVRKMGPFKVSFSLRNICVRFKNRSELLCVNPGDDSHAALHSDHKIIWLSPTENYFTFPGTLRLRCHRSQCFIDAEMRCAVSQTLSVHRGILKNILKLEENIWHEICHCSQVGVTLLNLSPFHHHTK